MSAAVAALLLGISTSVSASSPGANLTTPKPVLVPAQNRIFRLQSPIPVPWPIRVLGPSSAGFPQVVMVPAPPASVPIPYPGNPIRFQIRLPNGQWSGTITLNWSSGVVRLPSP